VNTACSSLASESVNFKHATVGTDLVVAVCLCVTLNAFRIQLAIPRTSNVNEQWGIRGPFALIGLILSHIIVPQSCSVDRLL
jgi:hypothetical protein